MGIYSIQNIYSINSSMYDNKHVLYNFLTEIV